MGEGVPARMPGFRARCACARRPSGRCRPCGPTRGRGDAASDHRAGVRRGPACLEHALRRAPLGGPADAGRVRSAPMPKAGPSPPACARRPPRSAVQRDGKDGAGRHDVRRPGDGACAADPGLPASRHRLPAARVEGHRSRRRRRGAGVVARAETDRGNLLRPTGSTPGISGPTSSSRGTGWRSSRRRRALRSNRRCRSRCSGISSTRPSPPSRRWGACAPWPCSRPG